MNIFLVLLLQLSFSNQSNKFPICYSEFSIPHGNYIKVISREYPNDVNYYGISCNRKERKFKLTDFYKIKYIDQLNQDSIEIELYKSNNIDFENCYISSLLDHINGGLNTKWETPYKILQINELKIYDISPSKVAELSKGHFYIFFTDPKTLIRIHTSPIKSSGLKAEGESQVESLVKLFVNHINSCNK